MNDKIMTEKEFSEWVRKLTPAAALEVWDHAMRERLIELSAPGSRGQLSEKEADALRRIKDYLENFEIKDRRVVIKAADALGEDVAPIPWGYWKRRGILFPKKSSPKTAMTWTTLENGERVVSTTADIGNKVVTHRGFIPAGVSEKDLPKLGNLTTDIYRASVFFQKAQIRQTNSVTWPHVTKGELLKFLGYDEKQRTRGGKILELIDQAYQTLAFFTFEIKDKKTGQIEEVDHILSWRRDMEGRGFYFKLNDDHTRLILALARGEKIEGHYAGLPLWLLRENMTPAKRGIFEELISLAGLQRPYPVFIKTILTKWAGLSEAEAKRKNSALALTEFLIPILNEAQDKGLIKGYAYDPRSARINNHLEWKILFSFHYKKKHYAVDPGLFAAMMELWGQPTLFDDREEAEKRREKKREQFTAIIKKHGAGQIGRIFEATKAEGEGAFWQKVKGDEGAGAE